MLAALFLQLLPCNFGGKTPCTRCGWLHERGAACNREPIKALPQRKENT